MTGLSVTISSCPARRPLARRRLAQLLVNNGIEVRRVTSAGTVKAKGGIESAAKDWPVPAGSYHVSVAQPAGRLARSLLDARFDMGEAFRKRQLDRKVRRLDDEIYDLTAWSLPLAFGVTSLTVEGPSKIASEPVATPRAAGTVTGPAQARVGYLIRAEDDAAMVALGDLLRHDFRVHVFDQPTALGGEKFAKGTLLLRTSENPDTLHEVIRRVALELRPVGPRDRHRARRRRGRPGRLPRELGQAAQGRDAGRPARVALRRPHLVSLRPGLAVPGDARPGFGALGARSLEVQRA